jgi:phosphatidylglycerol:prolipoprotein diacylglycerol transferase
MLEPLRDRLLDPEVPVFLVAQGFALAAALLLFGTRLRTSRLPRPGVISLAMGAGVLSGAAALGPLLRLPRTLFDSGADPFAPGWLMAYGALAGGGLGVALVARDARASALDTFVPAAGLLVAIGRLGCVASGCCFSHANVGPLAIAYPPGTPAFLHQVAEGSLDGAAAAAHPVLPVALFESVIGLVLVAIGLALPARVRPGSTFLLGATVYAAGRFAIELLRNDPRPMAGPFSLPQAISLMVLATAAWVWSRSPASEAGRAAPLSG